MNRYIIEKQATVEDSSMKKEVLQEEIREIADLFYQQKSKEGYGRLQELIADLSQYVAQIEEEAKRQELLEALTEALTAMQEQDTTLLADILQYSFYKHTTLTCSLYVTICSVPSTGYEYGATYNVTSCSFRSSCSYAS